MSCASETWTTYSRHFITWRKCCYQCHLHNKVTVRSNQLNLLPLPTPTPPILTFWTQSVDHIRMSVSSLLNGQSSECCCTNRLPGRQKNKIQGIHKTCLKKLKHSRWFLGISGNLCFSTHSEKQHLKVTQQHTNPPRLTNLPFCQPPAPCSST